jgi:hypothetical protein
MIQLQKLLPLFSPCSLVCLHVFCRAVIAWSLTVAARLSGTTTIARGTERSHPVVFLRLLFTNSRSTLHVDK